VNPPFQPDWRSPPLVADHNFVCLWKAEGERKTISYACESNVLPSRFVTIGGCPVNSANKAFFLMPGPAKRRMGIAVVSLLIAALFGKKSDDG
jgi:hypothetical protein